jgi:hypothetical protein
MNTTIQPNIAQRASYFTNQIIMKPTNTIGMGIGKGSSPSMYEMKEIRRSVVFGSNDGRKPLVLSRQGSSQITTPIPIQNDSQFAVVGQNPASRSIAVIW